MKLLIKILIAFILMTSVAWGADCGGVTACNSGDTVTSNYTLSENLSCTTGSGLILGSGVELDLNGYSIIGDDANCLNGILATSSDNILITGPGSIETTEEFGIKILGGIGITIQNLTIDDVFGSDGSTAGDGIYFGFNGSNEDEPQDVTVSGNTIGSGSNSIIRQGIAVTGGEDYTITGNTINGGRIGIDIEPNASRTLTGPVLITDNVINTLANTDAQGGQEYHFGISIDEITGTLEGVVQVTNNSINLNDEMFNSVATGLYIRSLENTGTFTMEGNSISGVKIGIYVFGPMDQTLNIKRNTVKGGPVNKSVGLNMYTNSAATAISNVTVSNNIFEDFLNTIDYNASSTGTVSANILNNDIDCDAVQYFCLRVKDFANTATIKNNIFFGTPSAGAVYLQVAGATPTVDIDYNLYESEGSYWNWQGYTDIAFAAWDDNADANGVNADPLFQSTTDFRLRRDSPAINVGDSTLGAAYATDYLGFNQDLYGAEWEIGAHAFVGGTITGGGSGTIEGTEP